MATWLASDELDFHGAWPVASGWLRRAHRLLDDLEPGPEHGWLAFHEGYLAHAEGGTAEACAAARLTVDLGRRFDVPGLEMLGLALEGASRVAAADVGEGMRCLDEATVTALVASSDDHAQSRPAWAAGPLVQLAELRRRQGRRVDAEHLLDRARPSHGAELCRGRLALDAGDAGRAVELAEPALRRLPRDAPLHRVPALKLLIRSRGAPGRAGRGCSGVNELGKTAHAIGTAWLLAAADLATGMLAAARGRHDRARPLLESAVDLFDASGERYEAAEARRELAVTLATLGRSDSAAHEARRSADSLATLGAEAEASRSRDILESPTRPAAPAVTRRERDVLRLLTEGLTNRQIAARLVVSEHTVHRHVTNILRKLELPSRTAAAAHAVRAGLLDDAS